MRFSQRAYRHNQSYVLFEYVAHMGIQSKHMYPIVVRSLDRRMLRSILRLAV